MNATRTEQDMIGSLQVPADAYYGIHSLRAAENFPITGQRLLPQMIYSLAWIKKACARANRLSGVLDEKIANAIEASCDEIIEGKLHDQFIVDPIQGGAGTSTNMNANEVIANRAIELLGGTKGDYSLVNPNDHVNCGQSTNDVYPSCGKMTLYTLTENLLDALHRLALAMDDKAAAFDGVVKMGRTQLQDAVPIRLGQEFAAYAAVLRREYARLACAQKEMLCLNLGGTAIGTGMNADPAFVHSVVSILSEMTGIPFVQSPDLIDSTQNLDCYTCLSSALRGCGVSLSKICNDLRLMSSGPLDGLAEIVLPARQNGSSIMPGKVNPVIPEVVNQIAFRLVGYDVTVAMAVEAGQLELNAFEPVLFYCLFESIEVLAHAADTFRIRCIDGVVVDAEHCSQLLMHSMAIGTALCPVIGYEKATAIVKKALKTHSTVVDVAVEELSMPREAIEKIVGDCLREHRN